jgi:hypothetical protein
MPKLIDDYPVPFRPLSEIEREMDRLRAFAGYLSKDRIDPDEFMSALGIKLSVLPTKKMGGARSFATAPDNTIWADREFSKDLRAGEPKCRHTWGHEVAHLALHRGSGPKARLAGDGNRSLVHIPGEISAECQAWKGSRALHMPRELFTASLSEAEIAEFVGLPIIAVEYRLREIADFDRSLLVEKRPVDLHQFLSKTAPTLIKHSELDEQRLRAWLQATPIEGENPDEFRIARGFKIRWADYKKLASESDYAWIEWGGEARCCRDVFSR